MKELELTSLNDIQSLLLRGKREDAVMSALSTKQYALALLIASVCDHSTYHLAARCFVEKALPLGTPLHTVTSLFANQIQSSDVNNASRDFWNEAHHNLEGTWRFHLASILSNQTQGWKKIVVALGDALLLKEKVQAAHFCYLVSGCPISSYDDPSSRLVLIGCDHHIKASQALATTESLVGYERLEALEWAKRKGNPNAVISTLQPFKLKYAEILADHGLDGAAKEYVDSIRKCTGIVDANEYEDDSSGPYDKAFAQSLDIIEDRLYLSLGIENEIQSKKTKQSLNLPSVLSKLVGGGLTGTKESRKKPEKEISTIDQSGVIDDDMDNTFESATSNLLNVTTATVRSTSTIQPPKIKDESSSNSESKEPVKAEEPAPTFMKYEAPKPLFNPIPKKDESANMKVKPIPDTKAGDISGNVAPNFVPMKIPNQPDGKLHVPPTTSTTRAPKSSPVKPKKEEKDEASSSGAPSAPSSGKFNIQLSLKFHVFLCI